MKKNEFKIISGLLFVGCFVGCSSCDLIILLSFVRMQNTFKMGPVYNTCSEIVKKKFDLVFVQLNDKNNSCVNYCDYYKLNPGNVSLLYH